MRFIALLLISINIFSCQKFERYGLSPGDNAPRLDLVTLSGEPASIVDYKGKVLMLNFWASWCEPCLSELPSLQKLSDKYRDKGFEILGIGVDDSSASLDDFRRKYGLSYPIFVDKNGSARSAYKMTGVPETFFLDKEGKILLFIDPETNEPVVKSTGPREWDNLQMIKQIEDWLR